MKANTPSLLSGERGEELALSRFWFVGMSLLFAHTLAFAQTTTPSTTYEILDLGTISGADTEAYSINEKGNVVGKSGSAAFFWSAQTGILTVAANAIAWDLNDLDQVVGVKDQTAFLWRRDQPSVFLLIGLANAHNRAFGINNAGAVVGAMAAQSLGINDSTLYRPFLYQYQNETVLVPAHLKLLGCISTFPATAHGATAVNASGNIAGFSSSGSETRGAFWSLNGTSLQDSSIVVSFVGLNNQNDAVGGERLWNPSGKSIALGSLGTGGTMARAINNRAFVVGQSKNAAGQLRAFSWQDKNGNHQTEGGEMIDLNGLLPTGSGWVLDDARGINEGGQIVGTGLRNGVRRAFRLSRIVSISGNAAGSLSGTLIRIVAASGATGANAIVTASATGNFTITSAQGIVPDDTYTVSAFADENGNNTKDRWEYAGNLSGGAVTTSGITSGANITLVRPPIVDTDGDGMDDDWERNYGLLVGVNDAALDKDGDGLTNLQEFLFQTNPIVADMDGDGLNDAQEILVYGTNPRSADTDGDGMPDGWEVTHGLDPRRNDANEDKDFDFLSNLEEYLAGTSPSKAISGTDGVPDYQKIRGKFAWAASYDKNDRLVGVRYEKQSFGFRYDGNGNLVGQARLGLDSDGDGLPDWWEYAHGLNPFSAVGNDGAAGDPDGDGWTNIQEYLAGTDPRDAVSRPGANGSPLATFDAPFTPTRFVTASGQLDGSGGDEFVVGADGDPGTQTNFVRIYSESGGWTYEQVPIGSFGVTSIAIGQITGRRPAVYLGLRKTGGIGRVVELTKTEAGWQVGLVVESTSDAAYVHGIRQSTQGVDLMFGVASRFGAELALYRAVYTGTDWKLSLLDNGRAVPRAGFTGSSESTMAKNRVVRELVTGGLQVADDSPYTSLDEFNGGAISSIWGSGGTIGDRGGVFQIVQTGGELRLQADWGGSSGDRHADAYLETSGLWAGGQRQLTISLLEATHSMADSTPIGAATVRLGNTTIFTTGTNQNFQNVEIQVMRSDSSAYHRSRIGAGIWTNWTASPLSSVLRFDVGGNKANGVGGTANLRIDAIRYGSLATMADSGASLADLAGTDAYYRSATGKWYFKTPSALSWLDAQDYANARGCDLVTVADVVTNSWLQNWSTGDVWLGYFRDFSLSPWRWPSGASPAFSIWATGQPGGAANQIYAYASGGVWSSASGSELKVGVFESRTRSNEVRSSLIAQQAAARLPWSGRTLQSGAFVSTASDQQSVIEAFVDDRDGSNSLSMGDEFVVAESVLTATGPQTRTLARRALAPTGPALGFALASVRLPGATAETLVTAEPDGQLAAWAPTPSGTEMRRQVLSVQRLGRVWHGLERLSMVGLGDGLVGLVVTPSAPQRAEIVLMSPTELSAGAATPLAQTPPSARVLAAPSAGGAVARVAVRVWDSESNPVRLQLQYQATATGPWLDATLKTIDRVPAAAATALGSSPGGVDHQLMWDAAANLGAAFRGTIAVRVRAADFAAAGNWSDPVYYAIDGAGDTDGDGMPDAWEIAHGLNPNVNDADGDLDGDGVSNLDEYLQGTDPNDANSAKYSLTVSGLGASVVKSPDQALYDKGTTVNVTASPQPATLSFIGWAPTAAIAGGGFAAAVTTNPLPVVMNSHKVITAYAGLPLADSLDTPELTWTTGGHKLWYGENSTTHDGIDAAEAAGLAAVDDEAWMETTVTAPGSVTWRGRLDIASGGGSIVQVLVGTTVADSMASATDWTQKTVPVTGSGPTKVRWRFVRQSASPAALSDAAFVDTVSFAAAALPVITFQPQSVSVGVGGNTGFAVAATSETTLTYRWQRKTTSQTEFTDLVGGSEYTGIATPTLALEGVVEGMTGAQFLCIVTNVTGSVSSSAATLTVVVPPTITAQPQPMSVQIGGQINFTVTAIGTAPFEYLWRKNGAPIAGAVSSVLAITNAQTSDAADYSVQVSNLAGAVTSTVAGLSVLTNSVAPAITSQPQDAIMTVGQTVTFAVSVSGLPTPTVQWRKNGANIVGATNTTLSLTNVQFSDAGSYFAVVSNLAGSVTSNPATLTVQPVPFAPRITTQPAGQTVNLGTTASFSVAADAFPAPSYQWRKDGIAISGATLTTLNVSVANSAAAGNYTVVVANTQGFVTSDPAVLVITSLPVITQQPVGQSISEGANVTLSLVATGSSPLAFQWRRDGVNILGATSATLALNNVTRDMAGTFSVVVSNSAGSVISDSATVNVVPHGTTAIHSVLFGGYVSGGTVTITNTMTFPDNAAGLGWQSLTPSGWIFSGAYGSAGDVKPVLGEEGLLEWAWLVIPQSPVTFSYTLTVPSGTTGPQEISALAIVRFGSGPESSLLAKPDPLQIAAVPLRHSADTNQDYRISLLELTRVIELFNTRNGTSRTGCYTVKEGSEDGFAQDSARQNGASVALPRYHSADTNRDGKINGVELTRVIELYQYRAGGNRTGQYRVQVDTEDGFAPGP